MGVYEMTKGERRSAPSPEKKSHKVMEMETALHPGPYPKSANGDLNVAYSLWSGYLKQCDSGNLWYSAIFIPTHQFTR